MFIRTHEMVLTKIVVTPQCAMQKSTYLDAALEE
jgi:hypothetical protein